MGSIVATSIGYGEVRYDDSELGSDRFVDTALMQAMHDSAMHKCDEAGQVRMNWVAPEAVRWSGTGDPYEGLLLDGDIGDPTAGTAAAPIWYPFGLQCRFAPKIRANGSGYPLRVRIAGSASGAGTVDFAVAVVPGNSSGRGWVYLPGAGLDVPVALLYYSGVSSTTPAWLTSDSGNVTLTPGQRIIDHAFAIEPSYTTETDIGGDPTTLIMPTIAVVVLGASRDAGVRPELHGLHVAEVSP
jgi:hypothetical protein